MTTAILQLPKYNIPCSIETNEDWVDALAFVDIDNNPVPLDGIAFSMSVRETETANWTIFKATTDDYLFILPAGARVSSIYSGGSGYQIGDTIVLPGDLELTVSGLSGSVISSVSIKKQGSFATIPSNPVGQLSTTGSGNLAKFVLTFVSNAFAILVPPDAMKSLQAGAFFYQVKAEADGYTFDVIEGDLTVSLGVDR